VYTGEKLKGAIYRVSQSVARQKIDKILLELQVKSGLFVGNEPKLNSVYDQHKTLLWFKSLGLMNTTSPRCVQRTPVTPQSTVFLEALIVR
jgi:hypothetical protein